ncbi:MAG: homoserine dehydrogenase [Lentisphaerae bacterium]|nr:homoserine dehydrogenase [Lentisphaerota bacterium]MBT4815311.1 homoserine dehydrogenase [Lentisphaerota bacterium]MBT5608159.1 homoserine dehydrogenase [Lentisphaerota bacterium]MBT7058707.1 homoserine dehydrogenase [Lentisphaerota bacterium]MBT7847663.1 homoserine dehydrogenase [Lentisphaerota bacterium]
MKTVNIGVIGFGTVGAGVVECVLQNGDLIAERSGLRPVIATIADLDITTDRGISLPDDVTLTTDASSLLNDPAIDVVVELVGGTTIAKDFVLQALANGKPVVTANKALLAHHGAEIFQAAQGSSSDVYYEASVGGGIPVIKAMREGLVGNRIVEIVGILNGTCNYILTRMEREKADFNDVLAAAQEAGYAETDPSFDVDGIDTAHKATILASLAYGEWFGMDPVHVEGIRNVTLQDIEYATNLGYRIKLLAIIKQEDANVEMRVHPALIPTSSLLGHVSGVFNAVWVEGDTVGGTMYYGRGAGREATASAVVADVMDVGLNLKFGSHHRVPAFRPHCAYSAIVPMADVATRYYLRLQVKDQPGVLALISGVLGQANISIASVTQQETSQASVPMIILTHQARESDLQAALDRMRELEEVVEPPVVIRIEDLG